MKIKQFTSRWILITGIVFCLIGIAHNSFAPEMYKTLQTEPLLKDKAQGLIYFFIVMGSAIILCGFLSIFSSSGIKKSEKWGKTIALSAAVFIALCAFTAIIFADFSNPLIYVMGICAFLNIAFLLIFFKKV